MAGCSACAKRRKALLALKAKQKERGQVIRAAMTGAVVTVSAAAGKAMGITGEDEHERTGSNSSSSDMPGYESRQGVDRSSEVSGPNSAGD